MKKVIEGSMAVAEAVKVCRPHVIAAYPITPQTHIVEYLSQFVADGELKTQFVNVESEFGAASVVLGASATGARVFSATSAQGLLLMAEVIFNIAGLRLPVIMTIANRAVSAPINIWNDHQDVMAVRDSGAIILFAEDNQEVADLHVQAYKIAEHPEIMLPVLVNMDGFILTHAFEPVEFFDQKMVDEFLPPYKPELYLTTKNPLTFGVLAEPDWYLETRYRMEQAIEASTDMIEEVADQFKKTFGRYSGGLVEKYRLDGAETCIIAMGSVVGTIKEVADELREKGKRVGVLKIRSYRPFPKEAVYEALKNVKNVIVIEKAISLGATGILYDDVKAALYQKPNQPKISGFIAGLGGRDIPKESVVKAIEKGEAQAVDNVFIDLKEHLIGGK
jgi:pyruvate ferredoxin oxidoreductase alpha subunit